MSFIHESAEMVNNLNERVRFSMPHYGVNRGLGIHGLNVNVI